MKFHLVIIALCVSIATATSYYRSRTFCRRRSLGHGSASPKRRIYYHGQRLTLSCDDGYTMIGKKSMRCRYGKWDNQMPRCEQVPTCGPLEVPDNGGITTTPKRRYDVGDDVTFTCDDRFELNGTATISCLEGGMWSDTEPVCEATGCRRPDEVENGFFEDDLTFYPVGERAWYICNDSYVLMGEKDITCLPGGEWSHDFPVCIAAPTCEVPTSPENGEFTIEGEDDSLERDVFYVGDVIAFTCNEGFTLEGTARVVCLPTEKWSHEEPICRSTATACFPPESFANGIFEEDKDSYEPGERLWFNCDKNYELEGTKDLTCQDNGKWDFGFPECVEQPTCGPPEAPDNGGFSPEQDSYGIGEVVTFDCDDDYELTNDNVFVCLPTGWSNNEPTCRRSAIATCSPPVAPDNGRVWPSHVTTYPVGYNVMFVCDARFQRRGAFVIRCKASGHWSARVPSCIRRTATCSRPEEPKDGDFSQKRDSYDVRSRVRFTCDDGFKLHGSRLIVCRSNGRWSASEPTCKSERVTCKRPAVPSNGVVTPDQAAFLPGEKLWFKCNAGNTGRGTKDLQCQTNGKWKPTPYFRCESDGSRGRCAGRCGEDDGDCQCNYLCRYRGTCCSDFQTACPRYYPRFRH